MKRVLKWIAAALLVPIVLLLIVAALLYLPPVQNWAVQRAAQYASDQTGMDISIGGLRISFPLDLKLNGLTVCLPQDETAFRCGLSDTLICVNEAIADLDLKRILKRQIGVEGLELKGGTLNLTITSSEDTTESTPLDLLLNINRISIADSRVSICLPEDSIRVSGMAEQVLLEGGTADLKNGHYAAQNFNLKATELSYDKGCLDCSVSTSNSDQTFIDYNHLHFNSISLGLKDFDYDQETGQLLGQLTNGSLKERSGLELKRAEAAIHLTPEGIRLKDLDMETLHSRAAGNIDFDWNATTPRRSLIGNNRGTMKADLNATLGWQDVLCLASSMMPENIAGNYPKEELQAQAKIEGSVDSLTVNKLHLYMPNVADLQAHGWVCDILDSTERRANVEWDAKTMNLNSVKRMAGLKDINLPSMVLNAKTKMKGDRYEVDALLTEGQGRAHLKGSLDAQTMAYKAQARLHQMQIQHFLPKDSLRELTATLIAEGRGFDLLSPRSSMSAQAKVEHLGYGQWDLDSVRADMKLHRGLATIDLNSQNKLLGFNGCVTASVNKTISDATFSMDMSHIDLYALGLVPKPLNVSMIMSMEGGSDLRDSHHIKGTVQAMELVLRDTILHPLDMQLEALMSPDTIFAHAEAGDMSLMMETQGGITTLTKQIDAMKSELKRQLSEYRLDQDTLRCLLPTVNLQLKTGEKNPLCNFMRSLGYSYERLNLDLSSNPIDGLNGTGYLHTLNTGAFLLDTIQIRIYQDSTGVNMDGRVRNGPKNKVVCFESNVHADITPTGAAASIVFRDAKGKKGVDLGMQTDLMENGYRIHFTPLNPVIAYRNFKLNEDNFVTMTREHRIEALIDLLADDGTGLKFYSTPNDDALQDLTLNVNHFNVGELAQVIPYMPDIAGLLHGDLHYMQSDSTTLSVSTDMTVKGMTYNKVLMGDIGLNGVYLPNTDGTHYVDGIITQNGREIVLTNGMYRQEKKQGMIEAMAQLQHFPMDLANVFIPDGVARLEGIANGELDVNGPTSAPLLSGHIATDSVKFVSDPYSINLTFPKDTIRISKSHIDLDRIEAYAAGNNPMVLDGTIDFSNLDRITLNVGINAKNYRLIDAPKSRNALAYGKVFVDLNGIVRGTLDHLTMRGRLNVLGNTDVTYVMKDSPITVEDQLADLVTFVDFTDTLETEVVERQQQYMEMQLMLSIEQATQVHCLLSENGNDYINLEGGGDLTMTYDNQNGMRLNGRYTILNGEMNYTVLPVIGSKHFNIKSGSYVEFQGDLLNPTLNVSANERVKATMTENNVPRSVAFDVGLRISQTLENMGLEFTLAAPEDLTAQNQLASMSSEERGRVAVTMLATGMYITDLGSSGGFNTTNTLNSYLQNEINHLVGMAQHTIDVNFGIENSTTETGSTSTDYSFSFAKRFWGNRITLTVGGKVRSGSDAVNTGQSIIDNVSLEYRLDQSATRYVKVYYDRNYESLLEGELTEMGAGVVFRRKTEKLGELFIFRKKKEER